MPSNDGHGIQPHITFHFQLLALFLRISSVCGRVCVYSFTASLRYEAMCCEARSRMLMRIEGIVEELSAVNKDENLNKEYKGKACDRLLKRLFKAITGAEKEIEELMVPYALIKKGGAA